MNAVQVIIGGIDQSHVLVQPSVSVNSAVGGVATAQFQIDDQAGVWFPPRGESVEVRVRDGRGSDCLPDETLLDEVCLPDGFPETRVMFGGTIRRWSMALFQWDKIQLSGASLLDEFQPDSQVIDPLDGTYWPRRFTIECTDYSHWFRRVVVADSPSWSSKTLKFIVEAICTTYMPAFAINTTGVATGPTLSYAVTKPVTVAQIFDDLSKLSGDDTLLWWVDEYGNLYFDEPLERLCPFQIDSTYTFNFQQSEEITIEETDEAYRNREIMVLESGTIVDEDDAAEIAAWGQWDKIEELRGTTDVPTATSIAQAQLRKFRVNKIASIRHREHGAKPGQRINIYLPSLGLTGPYGITDVRADVGWDWMANGEYEANVQYTMGISRSGEQLSDFREFFARKLRQ